MVEGDLRWRGSHGGHDGEGNEGVIGAASPCQGDSFYGYSRINKKFHQIAPKHPGNGHISG